MNKTHAELFADYQSAYLARERAQAACNAACDEMTRLRLALQKAEDAAQEAYRELMVGVLPPTEAK